MSDQDLVVETVRDILTGHEPFVLTAERPWDEGLWADLAEAGLTGVGLPEEAGGSGGELADAVAIVRTLASGAAAVSTARYAGRCDNPRVRRSWAIMSAATPEPPCSTKCTGVRARIAWRRW